jgi:hypothetical protein
MVTYSKEDWDRDVVYCGYSQAHGTHLAVAQVFPPVPVGVDKAEGVDAWEKLFELGEELAATDVR